MTSVRITISVDEDLHRAIQYLRGSTLLGRGLDIPYSFVICQLAKHGILRMAAQRRTMTETQIDNQTQNKWEKLEIQAPLSVFVLPAADAVGESVDLEWPPENVIEEMVRRAWNAKKRR